MRFDPNEVSDQEFDLLPEGVYRVMVNATAVKSNRTSDGNHVSVEFDVIDDRYKGRKLWHNFNVNNPNEKAQQIGRAQMKRFLAAIGITSAIDLASQLPALAKSKTLYVDVVHEPDFRDKTKMQEKIKKFDATREPSTASKAQGQAYQAPGLPPGPADDIPF